MFKSISMFPFQVSGFHFFLIGVLNEISTGLCNAITSTIKAVFNFWLRGYLIKCFRITETLSFSKTLSESSKIWVCLCSPLSPHKCSSDLRNNHPIHPSVLIVIITTIWSSALDTWYRKAAVANLLDLTTHKLATTALKHLFRKSLYHNHLKVVSDFINCDANVCQNWQGAEEMTIPISNPISEAPLSPGSHS